ncbi:MAG: ABC transporter permease [Bryobacteraceae bacterium]
MGTFWRDVQFGLRMLLSRPRFTLTAVVTLTIGIAANTTVFSWINGVVLHPIPGAGASQDLVLIESRTPGGEFLVNTSYLDYRDYRDSLTLVSGLAVARFTPLSIGEERKTERAWAELVSANYFDVLQVKPVLGRTFLAEEGVDKPGAYPVAVISYKMWQKRYQGDPKILGQTIRLNRQNLAIVGVAPRGFHGSLTGVVFDVWAPITMATAMGTGGGTLRYRGTRDLTSTIARLKPGVTPEQLRAEVTALAKRLATMYPDTNRAVEATVTPLWEGHLGVEKLLLKPLRVLMAVSVLLLLIVCANVANLLLSRAFARQREFAVRIAMGAGQFRLVTQMLTETLLLVAAGGIGGLLLTLWMRRSLLLLVPPIDIPLDLGGEVNFATLGFTMLIVLGTTLVCGIAPALMSLRTGLNETLKEGGRSGATESHSHRMQALLVGGEVALAVVGLIGAGLFLRSFRNASEIEPGFDTAHMSVSNFYLSYAGYSAAEQRLFCRKLRERMEEKPGVIGVTYTDFVPLVTTGLSPWHQLDIDGYVPAPDEQMMIHRATVPPGFFQVMGIPVREGREFTERDDEKAPLAIIINETFARRFLHGMNPVGHKLRLEGDPATIVGVVKDVKYHSLTEGPIPYFYLPFRQWFAPGLNFTIVMKTNGDPMRMIPTLRREASALNPDAVFTSNLLTDAATLSLYSQKVAASLLSGIGALCLLLAAMGLYSVMSYAITLRTRELGIRMALGAQPEDVLMMVARQTLRLTVPGLLVGIPVALGASRLIGGMLVGVAATDPITFAEAILCIIAVALLAGYLPGRRATRVDPMTALRCE